MCNIVIMGIEKGFDLIKITSIYRHQNEQMLYSIALIGRLKEIYLLSTVFMQDK